MMFTNQFKNLAAAVESCEYSTKDGPIYEDDALMIIFQKFRSIRALGGIVYVIGNGGSAGIASHFSTDLIKALQIPSQTLFDSNLMTCLSNDLGYENVFSYPLGKLIKPCDILVAISSSGKSSNIIKAAEVALAKKAYLITFSGFLEQNPLRQLGHLNFWTDRCNYGLVETSHFFLLHTIIDLYVKTREPDEQNQIVART